MIWAVGAGCFYLGVVFGCWAVTGLKVKPKERKILELDRLFEGTEMEITFEPFTMPEPEAEGIPWDKIGMGD